MSNEIAHQCEAASRFFQMRCKLISEVPRSREVRTSTHPLWCERNMRQASVCNPVWEHERRDHAVRPARACCKNAPVRASVARLDSLAAHGCV
jgi:hypothetical protein